MKKSKKKKVAKDLSRAEYYHVNDKDYCAAIYIVSALRRVGIEMTEDERHALYRYLLYGDQKRREILNHIILYSDEGADEK